VAAGAEEQEEGAVAEVAVRAVVAVAGAVAVAAGEVVVVAGAVAALREEAEPSASVSVAGRSFGREGCRRARRRRPRS
jgi:predicted NBD/HSP70 family sugar kinase